MEQIHVRIYKHFTFVMFENVQVDFNFFYLLLILMFAPTAIRQGLCRPVTPS